LSLTYAVFLRRPVTFSFLGSKILFFRVLKSRKRERTMKRYYLLVNRAKPDVLPVSHSFPFKKSTYFKIKILDFMYRKHPPLALNLSK
jgi:hypothetical protein